MPKETKIASYQEKGIRLQLIKIGVDKEQKRKEVQEFYNTGKKIFTPDYYQIRKNRKVLCNIKFLNPARQKFLAIIQQELLQTIIDEYAR